MYERSVHLLHCSQSVVLSICQCSLSGHVTLGSVSFGVFGDLFAVGMSPVEEEFDWSFVSVSMLFEIIEAMIISLTSHII